MKRFNYLFLFLLFFSCQKQQQPDYLEQALVLAGENRPELEKVLQHYATNPEDSLKYQAAVFLIENMPGHYSYKNEKYLDQYYDEIAEAVSPKQTRELNKSTMEAISGRYREKSRAHIQDIEIISADYLIHNIEQAFEVWENGEWATHVSFDDFCELILPYKGVELQTLDHWRTYSKELLKGDLDDLHNCDLYKNSAYWAATAINTEIIKLQSQELPVGGVNALPIFRIHTLSQMPFGTCGDYSVLAMALMRSQGIPVTEDCTPQWSWQSFGHSWNVLLNNKGKMITFSAGSSNPNEQHMPDERMGKVFRRTYAINREIQQLNKTEVYVPSIFKNHFMRDVTDEYMNTQDIEISIPDSLKNEYQYGYLAVFDNRNWVPLHYGKVLNGKIQFNKMGLNSMYLPVFFDKEGIIPFASPFFINAKGEVIRCETSNQMQDITVRRKYFIDERCYIISNRLKGGKFQVAHHADFRDSVTIYQILERIAQSGEFNVPETIGKYRYWRYLSAEEMHNNMAEIYFYQDGDPDPVYGKIIGTSGSYVNEKWHEKEVVFDNDPLNYYDAIEPSGSWVGMDFGEPISISQISYTPRGDGNDITPGDMHELLYWDNQWISLGKKKASDIKMVYENVPAGTIYWIRNLSRVCKRMI